MKSYKVITGLTASPSETRRSFHNLKATGYDNMYIDQLLDVASKRLGPILRNLMESSAVEHFLSLEECEEIKEISKLICAVVKALESTGLTLNIKSTINVNMDKHRRSLKNPPGYVFVNTTLLLEIIELFNSLENLRHDLEILYKSIGIHSYVQTESGLLLSLTNSESTTSNKIVFKLNKPLANNNNASFTLVNDYIVMPSQSSIPSLSESKSPSSRHFVDKQQTRRSRSADASDNEEGYEVKDVYGAKEVIVKCIYDLQDVSSYLGIERKDVATVCSPAEMVYNGPSTSEQRRTSRSFSNTDEVPQDVDETMEQQNYDSEPENYDNEADNYESDGEKCCCQDCIGSPSRTAGLKDEDQVVICIKGCNENEGDIQIVIRQCPDCDKAKSGSKPLESGTDPEQFSKASMYSSKAPTQASIHSTKAPTRASKASMHSTKASTRASKASMHPSLDSIKRTLARTRPEETESTILHNKDSLGSVVCSDEEDEEDRRRSIECSRIELFETRNLCLQTDTGQEFVISLTISPKDALDRQISLGEIFSDDKTPIVQRETYYADDRYIPLVRTKVCSSLEFDVKTVESKLKRKGQIDNKDNRIVVRLEDFGTENLLRACRPAKCCRKAILNEKMKKCLPYSASIRSLPLDEDDLVVINESLEMSLQKVKNSTNLQKEAAYNNPNMYFNSIYSVMYFSVNFDGQSLVKQKLNYYINLVDDLRCNKDANYDVYYFGVQRSLLQQVETRKERKAMSNRSLGKDVAPTRSNPLKWMKEKYYKFQPVLFSPQDLISKNDSFIDRSARNIPESRKKNSQAPSKKLYSSRIPIPVCQNQHKPISNSSCDKLIGTDVSDEIEINEIYNGSLTSVRPQLREFIEKKSQDSKQDTDSLGEKIAKFIQQTEKSGSILNYYEKVQDSTKSSVTSNFLKYKRKRKEYYLPRSSSDTSLSTPKQMCKLKSNKPKNSVLSTKKGNEDASFFSLVNNRDSSRLILKYFTKVLCEMIMKQMIKDKLVYKDQKQISIKHVSIGTEKASLQEIYRNQHKRKIQNNSSFYDLKAKQPQVCLTQENSVKPLDRFKTVGLQTSKNIGEAKQSQTSNTLLDNFFQMERKSFKKELIFKQLYNYNEQNSCDEIENFTVAFTSNQSFNEKLSCDFTTSESELFGDSENCTEETLEDSLNKLKETLEKYEIVKSKIDETTVNPIEYFVYHLCACESILNKKPTVMQRILGKTKGLFSAVEKSFKSKNATCPTCGCNISSCQGGTSNANKPSASCTCPEELHKPKAFQPCCKKQAKPKTSSISAQIKKSICDLFGSYKKLEPCKCTRSQHGDALYIPVDNVRSSRKNVAVGTTKKCGCVKCENFDAQDGTCCCSHCLGCLDKCFETAPENKSIAVAADASVNSPENSKETNTEVPSVNSEKSVTIKDDSDVAEVITLNKDEEDAGNRNDTQTYFFMAPTSQLRRPGNENPFQQYLLNFPNFNVIQVDNPDNSNNNCRR